VRPTPLKRTGRGSCQCGLTSIKAPDHSTGYEGRTKVVTLLNRCYFTLPSLGSSSNTRGLHSLNVLPIVSTPVARLQTFLLTRHFGSGRFELRLGPSDTTPEAEIEY